MFTRQKITLVDGIILGIILAVIAYAAVVVFSENLPLGD